MPHTKRTGLLAAFGLLVGLLAMLAVPTVSMAAGGQVCMGVVVDDGSGGAPTPQAAQVSPGTSDLQALSAAKDSATQNSSGLVCLINNFPTDGLQNCTRVSGGLYYYWSYWHGDPASNTWTYGQAGPASHAVAAGQTYVEGWRYQNPGPDTASAPPPNISPAAAFAAACPGITPVPASSGGSAGSAGSGGGGATGSSASANGAGTTPASASSSPSGAVSTTAPAPSGAATSPSTASSKGHGTSAAGPGATTTPSGVAPGSAGNTAGSTTTTSPGVRKGKGRSGAAALASSTPHGGSDSAPVLSIVVVAIVIAAIGGLSLYRWRRRPAEE